MQRIFSQFIAYMIVYMEIAIANIISLPDEYGVDHLTDFLLILEETADHPSKVKYQFIMQAWNLLAYVKKDQLPTAGKPLYESFNISVDGKDYEHRLAYVGYLHKQPIYELRISLEPFNWFFRATFFPAYHEGRLFYCFVFPFEKNPFSPIDPTDHYKEMTYQVLVDLRSNRQKYEPFFSE